MHEPEKVRFFPAWGGGSTPTRHLVPRYKRKHGLCKVVQQRTALRSLVIVTEAELKDLLLIGPRVDPCTMYKLTRVSMDVI